MQALLSVDFSCSETERQREDESSIGSVRHCNVMELQGDEKNRADEHRH